MTQTPLPAPAWPTLLLSATLAVAVAAISVTPAARADEIYTFVVKKQEQKAETRWSLSQWLETRDKMRLMDLWLALHSPTPFEFYVGAEYRKPSTATSVLPGGGFRTDIAAYATIFGLEFQKGWDPESEWNGMFLLRLFGFHAQGTNITLQSGFRSSETPYVLRSLYFGPSFTLYIAKYFGLEGLYRYHFNRAFGQRTEAGAFIDFKFIRVYGNFYWESALGVTGNSLGTKIFF